jgi:hypothetical protein
MKIVTIHAERIYDKRVWYRLYKLMRLFINNDIYATIFVYPPLHERHTSHPSYSLDSLNQFNNRVEILKSMGHDIQLHSHFYKKGAKENDFSDENIHRVLFSEIQCLNNIGINPIGFVAGGWNFPENIIKILPEYGIKYDCSCLKEMPKNFKPIQPKIKTNIVTRFDNGLIEIPTTDTTKSYLFKFNTNKYRMFYFHDYDLLNTKLY